MSLDAFVPLGARLVSAWDAFLALPGARAVVEAAIFLCGTSGTFWLLSRFLSRAAKALHDALDESLAALFAVSYNVALAALFGAVMAAAAFAAAHGSAFLLAYQAAALVFVYLVLGAAYFDEEGRLDEYSGAGYVGGLAAFLACSVRTQWLSLPVVVHAQGLVAWAWHGWLGKLAGTVAAAEGALYAADRLRRKLFFRSFKIGRRRFFLLA